MTIKDGEASGKVAEILAHECFADDRAEYPQALGRVLPIAKRITNAGK